MSNGIGKNPLLDISKVYLEQIVEKKDDSYLEPDMKKRQKNNEKARKELAKGPQMKNPHFEEKQQGWDVVNSLSDAFKAMQEEGYKGKHGQSDKEYADSRSSGGKMVSGDSKMSGAEYTHGRRVKAANPGMQSDVGGKTKPKSQGKMDAGSREDLMYRKANLKRKHRISKMAKEELDPVGNEDGDVNNDGKKDKTDKYLMNRRKAIGSAIKNKMSTMKKEETDVDKYIETVAKVKEVERANDVQRWIQKESRSSNWRQDLSEIMIDDEDSKPIKEKNVKNKIKINPKLGEAVEEIGGSLIEHIEIYEMDFIIESVYDELLEEGYAEDDVEEAIENAMEATVTFGSDTKPMKKDGSQVGSRRKFLKRKAGEFLQKSKKKVGMAVAQARVDAYNKKREVKQAATDKVNQKKQGLKNFIKNKAQKVVDRMSEENVGEAVYGGEPEKKKDTRMVVTNADKKANTPAYRAYKAGNKKYKSADHMGEEVENIEELHKGRHGQSEKEYQDSRSDAGKMVSGDSKMSGSRYAQGRRTSSDAGPQTAGGSQKPASQGKMDSGSRTDLTFRKAALKKKAAEMKEDASMTPQEIALQKKKAMLDRMIAQRRQQGLNKVKKSEAPTKAMGEETECDHSMKGKECPVHGKKDCSSMKEATEDSLRDRRMERGGVGGNQRYNKPVSNTPNTFGKKKPATGGMSALEKVKASIRAKHGQGAIKEDAKMAKQSDEKLAALHKQVSASDQSLPSNQFMMKRVSKEMNRRKNAT